MIISLTGRHETRGGFDMPRTARLVILVDISVNEKLYTSNHLNLLGSIAFERLMAEADIRFKNRSSAYRKVARSAMRSTFSGYRAGLWFRTRYLRMKES